MAEHVVSVYDRIFRRALEITLKALEAGAVSFRTEGDLRAHLYHECARQLESDDRQRPLPLHAEYNIGRTKADLALGPDGEVVVELKYEPYASEDGSLFVFEREGSHNIEKDVKKLDRYAADGRMAHLVMVEKRYSDGSYYFPDWTDKIGIPKRSWTTAEQYAWVHYVKRPDSKRGER